MKGISKKEMNVMDAFIKTSDKRFRVRSCGIIIKDNKVLMVKNNKDDYYYSLGGAIHIGETIEEACLREVLEETGYPYEIERLQFIYESIFEKDNMLWHELAFYFLMKSADNDKFIINEEAYGMLENKVWLPIDKFNEYKAFPKFFAEELLDLNEDVKIITTLE